ncbi:MSMEG_0570 family nitrogen starvation response protein [Oscillatoria sp. FACHB-1407]|uniref:MSMEG_0570 family nitrogen starvation response protein n=1 Tax=Oscillatoria sp. FACHB-1407 TaxID=2692847 RepID=UPI001682FAB1|nr:MSMEG_0570 family nitrogen starvation response protein [Oscillatoria sp. FACHB-1407]MBD2460475.1 MSMEG_0570 family nitrogen starvation response protein [Oscillatoria sp. FACHB-1407]
MPEIRFQVQWPDGSKETCYSPSLIVKEYFTPGSEYDLEDFVVRSRTALNIASDRVLAKYGMPCGLALGQLRQIEETATRFQALEHPKVQVLQFIE